MASDEASPARRAYINDVNAQLRRRARRWRRFILPLAALSLAAAACGSTVPEAQLEAALQNQGLGGEPGVNGTLSPGATVPGTTGSALPGQGGTGGLPGTAGGGSLGPGITPTTMYVGAVYLKNQAAGNAALGAAGQAAPDYRDMYNALLDDINKAGGIAGRKVVPVYAELDVTSSRTIDQQAQSMCAKWTQDNKVFAMLAGAQGGVIQECNERAGTVNILSGGDSVPETFRRYPHYIEVAGMNLVRQGSVTVKGLKAGGFFDAGAQLGIVTWDAGNYKQTLEQGYVPQLRSIGVTMATQPAYIHVPQSFSDLGGMNQDVNSAVLRFSSQGITHVIIVDGAAGVCAGACLGYEFLNQAKSQSYTPRYGFNEYNYAAGSAEDGLYPKSQLVNSVAVVWGNDEDAGQPYSNKQQVRCADTMDRHGIQLNGNIAEGTAYIICEQVWFFQFVVNRMKGMVLNADNFIRTVNGVGSDYAPTTTYLSFLSATQHDGAAAVRNQRYDAGDGVYVYTSAPYRV